MLAEETGNDKGKRKQPIQGALFKPAATLELNPMVQLLEIK